MALCIYSVLAANKQTCPTLTLACLAMAKHYKQNQINVKCKDASPLPPATAESVTLIFRFFSSGQSPFPLYASSSRAVFNAKTPSSIEVVTSCSSAGCLAASNVGASTNCPVSERPDGACPPRPSPHRQSRLSQSRLAAIVSILHHSPVLGQRVMLRAT